MRIWLEWQNDLWLRSLTNGGFAPIYPMYKTKEERKQGLLEKLKREAMNRRQVKDAIFCVQQTADEYLAELKAEGKIYIAFWNRTNGMPSPYYMAGDGFDAEKPKPLSNAEYTANYENRKASGQSSVRSSPKPVNDEHLVSRCIASMVRNANMNPAIKLPD